MDSDVLRIRHRVHAIFAINRELRFQHFGNPTLEKLRIHRGQLVQVIDAVVIFELRRLANAAESQAVKLDFLPTRQALHAKVGPMP